MVRTRMFKSGEDYAVELPDDIAYDDPDMELEITRNGDVITVHPVREQNLPPGAEPDKNTNQKDKQK